MPQVPKHFTLEPERCGDTVFVRLGGELDMSAGEHFDGVADELFESARTIVVDLTQLAFIDSSGMRSLLAVWRRAIEEGRDMAVVPGNGQVRSTMELTGVHEVLPIVAEAPLPAPDTT